MEGRGICVFHVTFSTWCQVQGISPCLNLAAFSLGCWCFYLSKVQMVLSNSVHRLGWVGAVSVLLLSRGFTWLCKSSTRGASLWHCQLFPQLGPCMALCLWPKGLFWQCSGSVNEIQLYKVSLNMCWRSASLLGKAQVRRRRSSIFSASFFLRRGILCFSGVCLILMTGTRRLLLKFENPLTLAFLNKDRWNKD